MVQIKSKIIFNFKTDARNRYNIFGKIWIRIILYDNFYTYLIESNKDGFDTTIEFWSRSKIWILKKF